MNLIYTNPGQPDPDRHLIYLLIDFLNVCRAMSVFIYLQHRSIYCRSRSTVKKTKKQQLCVMNLICTNSGQPDPR